MLRKLNSIVERPFLWVKWFLTRRIIAWRTKPQSREDMRSMIEIMHVRALEAERLERPTEHQQARGAEMALKWVCRELESLDVGR